MFPYYFVTSKDTGVGAGGGTKGRKNPDQDKCVFLTFFFFCQGVTQKGRQGGKPQSLFGLSYAGKCVS